MRRTPGEQPAPSGCSSSIRGPDGPSPSTSIGSAIREAVQGGRDAHRKPRPPKLEGITILDSRHIAIVNVDDFGVLGEGGAAPPKSWLFVITLGGAAASGPGRGAGAVDSQRHDSRRDVPKSRQRAGLFPTDTALPSTTPFSMMSHESDTGRVGVW